MKEEKKTIAKAVVLDDLTLLCFRNLLFALPIQLKQAAIEISARTNRSVQARVKKKKLTQIIEIVYITTFYAMRKFIKIEHY